MSLTRLVTVGVGTLVLLASSLSAAGTAAAPGDVPPPGANDWTCKPSSRHPQPVVLVNGTFESMTKNWPTLSPYLANRDYCVFAFNYGNFATGPVADSARELKAFVGRVLRRTGARQVDLVGHSQGGMMPRYYLKFLRGAPKVDDLVGIAPSNHGTEGLIVAPPDFVPDTGPGGDNPLCQACADQQAGSPFMRRLNRDGDTVRGPDYTVIATKYDEVVTPYRSQFLRGPRLRVTNILIQNKCPLDPIEHDQAPNDPVVHQLVRHALHRNGPAARDFQPRCLPVVPSP